jgi:hypothetical protein
MSEENKVEALRKFKERLVSHLFIKNCITEDFFLLAFLRSRNFSLDEALKVLEFYFIFRYEHKEWFDLSDKQVAKYREIVKSGFNYLARGENDDASLLMLTSVANADVEKFSVDDIYHCFFTNFTLALFDEMTQISGLRIVSNLSNVSLKQIGIYPVSHVVNFGKHMAHSPVSFQQYSLIGVPSFAQQIVSVLKMALPEKIRNQTKVMKDFSELAEVMSVACLPEEFGGRMQQSEMIEMHLRNFEDKLPKLREIANFELNTDKIEKSVGIELASNFKQLCID